MKTRKIFAIILALGLILCQVPGIAVAAETTTESSPLEVVTETITESEAAAEPEVTVAPDTPETMVLLENPEAADVPGIAVAAETTTESSPSEVVTETITESEAAAEPEATVVPGTPETTVVPENPEAADVPDESGEADAAPTEAAPLLSAVPDTDEITVTIDPNGGAVSVASTTFPKGTSVTVRGYSRRIDVVNADSSSRENNIYPSLTSPANHQLSAIEVNGTKYENRAATFTASEDVTVKLLWVQEINSAEITINPPRVGVNSSDVNTTGFVSTPSGAPYTATFLGWRQGGDYNAVWSGAFESDNTYYARIRVQIPDGNDFVWGWQSPSDMQNGLTIHGGSFNRAMAVGGDLSKVQEFNVSFTPAVSASTARNHLSATSGGSVSWQEVASGGAAKIGTVTAGSTFEINGDYGVADGSTVSLTATPASGYKFKGWYTQWNSTSPNLVSTNPTYTWTLPTDFGTELTAAFTDDAAPTPITSVSINVTPPAAGTTVGNAQNAVSVPSDANYSISGIAYYYEDPRPDYSDPPLPDPATLPAGYTVYAMFTLAANDGYMFQQGAPGTAVNLTGSGVTLLSSNPLDVTNIAFSDDYKVSYSSCLVSFTIPGTGVADVYVDNTVDNSMTYITGVVDITGTGGTQAGYNPGKTVYENSEAVTYSNPRTARVQGMMDDAYTKVYQLANACKNNGSSGVFSMNTSDSTGRVWDNRRYITYEYNSTTSQWESTTASGETLVYTGEIPSTAGTNTRIHVAEGDYGKETYYRMEANGWVDGWAITVSDDGNGTGSAAFEASLAGETVTLSATPSSGYAFDKWVVVSGDIALDNEAAASATFTMPKANVEVKATFKSVHVHNWGTPTYTWADDNSSVTATRVCADDTTHVETETVNTTAEITKPATCVAKGETTYTATFENAAFATQTKTVEDVAIDPNAHDWDNGTITTAPTCTEKGVKTYTCVNDASHTKTEDVDALGHDWGAWTQTKAPTCTEEGTEERVCNHDASHKETRSVAKIDHTWDAGVVTKAATCEEDGVKTYTCTVCGETKTEVISALGHDWDDGIVTTDPTCTEKGVKTFTCKHDASHTKTEDVDALGHTWGAWTVKKEATETEDGEETRTCSVCGEIETRAIPHLVVEYRNTEGDGSKWKKGSSETLEFVFKRSINDETSFSHFTGIQVDGADVDASNYTAVSGSVVVNLKPAYLETLATGEHTITALFDDGNNPTAKFTVTEKKQAASTDNNGNTDEKTPAKANDTITASTSPATGDNSNIALWGIVMIASLLCLIFALISRRSYLRKR